MSENKLVTRYKENLRVFGRYLKLLGRYALTRRRTDVWKVALVANSEYFSAHFYLRRYGDVAISGVDPLIHYFDYGADEGRWPSELFDTGYYLKEHPELKGSKENPLVHFLLVGRRANYRALPQPKFYAAKLKPKPAVNNPPHKSLYGDDGYTSHEISTDRLVIFTTVVGGYDDLKPPVHRPFNCDFVVFSDRPMQVEGWEARPLNFVHADPTRAARFVKLHPHLYFPEYRYSIWIDGNISVIGDVRPFLNKLDATCFLSSFRHPLRSCIYEEGVECIARRKDDEIVITRHLDRYRDANVGEDIGLWETNVLVRRHNEPACIKLSVAWWREIQIGSKRDQLSLPVICQQQAISINSLDNPGISARVHPLLAFHSHRAKRLPDDPNIFWPIAARPIALKTQSVTIGVCVHGALPYVRNCLESALMSRGVDDRIVIVDDASDEETRVYLNAFAQKYPNVDLVRNEINLGYTRSANHILMSAQSDWIVLLNSDAILARGSIRKLLNAGGEHSRLAAVGPLSNAASWQTVPKLAGPEGFFVNEMPRGFTVEDMDDLCRMAALPTVQFTPLLNGFCFGIRRSVLDKIGAFDEENFPIGYGEEDDWCIRAADAGYYCGVATNTFVYHAKSATFTSSRRKMLVAAGAEALARKHTADRIVASSLMMKEHAGLSVARERIGVLLRRERARRIESGRT